MSSKVIESNPNDVSINAVYYLDATDRSVCDEFVREAQRIDDLRVEAPELQQQPALPSITVLADIQPDLQQAENSNATNNKKRASSSRAGGKKEMKK